MVKNIEAAKELVEKYREITMEKLKEVSDELYAEYEDDYTYEEVLHRITGFGRISTCILCKEINHMCEYCIHYKHQDSYDSSCPCANSETYRAFDEVDDLDGLYDAIQARADYIASLIQMEENDN